MRFIRPNQLRPSSIGVIHSGEILEAVVTSIPFGAGRPVEGGIAEHVSEAFRQIDAVLSEAGLRRESICSARVYLQDVHAHAGEMNRQWKAFFGEHAPCRRCYGVQLQAGMLIEIAFVAEIQDPRPMSAAR